MHTRAGWFVSQVLVLHSLDTHLSLLLRTGTCPENGADWHWELRIATGLWLTSPAVENKL